MFKSKRCSSTRKIFEVRNGAAIYQKSPEILFRSKLLTEFMEEIFKKIRNLLLGGALLFAVFGILPAAAQAATLYFSPSSGSYAVGSSIVLNVYVSSAGQAMNAASGMISFPGDKLEVTTLSKTGSIFSLWLQEPSFSNLAGTVNFEGIALNPGFTGASGKLLTVNFRVKTAGVAALNFSSGSVLANDGQGTNILASLGNAQFSLGGAIAPSAPEATTPSEVEGTPLAPPVSSPTHPDPNKWYAADDAEFTWSVPSDATAARLLVGKIPQVVPTVYYLPAVSSKELSNLEDGIWYFHVRLRNATGWGGISHFRFQIDTKPPEPFSIKFVDGQETENPRPTALFNTTDMLSGIAYYKVKIGEGDFFSIAPETVKQNPYVLPLQAPGRRTILVQAFDQAGNYTTASEEFIIQALTPPEIKEYPTQLQSGETLIARGKSLYPRSTIVIWLQRENEKEKSASVTSDDRGEFVFIADEKLKDGIYKVWAEVIDERGARSTAPEKVTISVERPALLRIGSWAVGFLAVVVPLIALVFLLVYFAYHWWHKFATLRKRVRKEIREAEHALHEAFDLLKEAIREQIKMLEKTKSKRELTEEEEKIIKQLKQDLDDAEKYVRKEIEDVEKEVK